MKKILAICLILAAGKLCYPQYTVTKVIGTVKKKSSGETLKAGSRFNDGDALLWSSQKDMVRTIVAGQGVYIMTPSPSAKSQGSDLLEIVKFTLHVKSSNGNLSGRSDASELVPGVLETEASVSTKNLIEKENEYLFDEKAYDVSEGSRFFLQEEDTGGNPVITPLKTKGDTLLLSAYDFKKRGSNVAGIKYKLGFFSKNNNRSELLIQIDPYFDSTDEMTTIIKLMIRESKEKDRKKLQDECYNEVYQALGKPSDILFQNVFDSLSKK